MNLKYNIKEKPPKMEMLISGIQWLAITLPIILIVGNVIGNLFPDINTVVYIQSLFIMVGIAILLQITFGHGLPSIIGPGTVLLIAVIVTLNQGIGSINSSLIIGGAILAVVAFSGGMKYIEKLFSSKVIIVILVLIAFTLIPSILNLTIANNGVLSSINFIFVLISLFIVLIAHKFFKGLWNSVIPLGIMVFGSIFYFLILNQKIMGNFNVSTIAAPNIQVNLAVPDLGIVLAFLICFLALAINDVGSIQAIGAVVKLEKMEKRIKKGLGITGIMNVLSGIMGVIGPVNYSMTPGIIAATKNASKYPLYITGIALIFIAFSPFLVAVISAIPTPIIAVVLIYILTAQIGAAIMLAKENNSFKNMDDGIIVGLPIIVGTMIAFLPNTVTTEFPLLIRSLLGNAFVMGIIIALFLEHLIFKKKKENTNNE